VVTVPLFERLLGSVFVCFFPILFFLFMLGGLVLREVCGFLKAGKPTLLSATGMVFFEAVLTVLLAGVMVQALELDRGMRVANDELLWLGTLGISLVVTMFAAAALFTGTLEHVSYGTALAIYWLHMVVLFALLAGGAALAVAAWMVLG
jgi:hypothetical protein